MTDVNREEGGDVNICNECWTFAGGEGEELSELSQSLFFARRLRRSLPATKCSPNEVDFGRPGTWRRERHGSQRSSFIMH